MKIRTIIESPYAGAVGLHLEYLKLCMLDSLNRGEAPFASHGFYTLVLDDTNSLQRQHGMEAGFAWGEVAQRVAVYTDLGITDGMKKGIARHEEHKIEVVYRKLAHGTGIRVPVIVE